MRRYSPKWWPEYSGITGRDQMESVTGMKWNQWPGSNGMGGRNGMESMAGIVWNMQLSRDIEKLNALRRSLVIYRMVFGQTSQEDMVEYLLSKISAEEVEQVSKQLNIHLGPPRFEES